MFVILVCVWVGERERERERWTDTPVWHEEQIKITQCHSFIFIF